MKKYLLLLAVLFSFPAFASKCFVVPYSAMTTTPGGRDIPVPGPALDVPMVVTLQAATSVPTAAMPANTRYIGIICEAKAHYLRGVALATPTASASDIYIPQDLTLFLEIAVNQKIAFYLE